LAAQEVLVIRSHVHFLVDVGGAAVSRALVVRCARVLLLWGLGAEAAIVEAHGHACASEVVTCVRECLRLSGEGLAILIHFRFLCSICIWNHCCGPSLPCLIIESVEGAFHDAVVSFDALRVRVPVSVFVNRLLLLTDQGLLSLGGPRRVL
jgi:hypothetical protein